MDVFIVKVEEEDTPTCNLDAVDSAVDSPKSQSTTVDSVLAKNLYTDTKSTS